MTARHAVALIASRDHACYRYRIEPFARALRERGWSLQAIPLQKHTWDRMGQLRALRRADLVLLQKMLLPIWQVALLRRMCRRLVYDLDDAMFRRDSYSSKGPKSLTRRTRFWATLRAADAAIVGNEYLRQVVSAHLRPRSVHVVPTCVDPWRYCMARHDRAAGAARDGNVELVWIGQRSTLASLQRAGQHLTAAAERLPGLTLRLICDASLDLSPLTVVPRRWSSATEASELAAADIGICWQPDDTWSRGKCGLKILQYMAAGLPVVANPVGVHRDKVIDGRTGFLASTPDQWAAAIGRLAADPGLRRTLGAAGRRLVEDKYSVAAWEGEFATMIDSVALGSPTDQRAPAA